VLVQACYSCPAHRSTGESPVAPERLLPKTMAEKNEKDRVVDENPYRSPETSPPTAAEMPGDKDKLGDSGCLVLVLIALPLLDILGMLMSRAGPYSPVMLTLGLGGFACGAALGAYVSVTVIHRPWWSSCRWAIYGLIGMCLPTFILFAVLFGWP
jgi:hypothetical protein